MLSFLCLRGKDRLRKQKRQAVPDLRFSEATQPAVFFFFWISLCFVFLFSFCLFVCQRHDTPLSTVRYLPSVRSIIPHIPLPAANAIRWKSSSAVHDQRGDQRGQLLQALREGILCTCNELRIARVCLYGVVIFCLCFGVVTLPACQVPVWRGRCVYACMDACT